MSEPKEPLILAIETATRAGSVALSRGKESLRSASGDASASHSTDLIQMVEGILTSGGAKAERHRFVRGRARAWKFHRLANRSGDNKIFRGVHRKKLRRSFDSGRDSSRGRTFGTHGVALTRGTRRTVRAKVFS